MRPLDYEDNKICQMCGIKGFDNPFIYCDECMTIDKSIISMFETNRHRMTKKDIDRVTKALKLLRNE